MADVPAGKLRLHLMAEKSLGLSSLPVGKRAGKKAGGANSSPAPRVVPAAPARAMAPVIRAAPAAAASIPVQASVTQASAPASPGKSPPVKVTPVMATGSMFGDDGLANVPFAAEPLPLEQKRVRLQQMDDGEVKGCTFCRLCETRTKTVFGEGDPDAKLMFIGEGPGENEDLQGRPFVGRAGELLDKQIGAMGLSRAQVFIANIVKCRPPGNRQPAPDETAACTPYLMRQIEIIRPRVIVTLGLPSTQFILQKKESMSRMRGVWHEWRGIGVLPTYHPAYLLRNYTAETRRMVWEDLQKVMGRLGIKAKGPGVG